MWMNIWTDNVSGRQEMNGSKDLKTIIYFKGVYDTLDLFTDHLIEAFESMGYGTFVYHTANEEVSKKMLLRLLDESQEFAVVTFNNLGYNLSFEQSEAAENEEKNRKNIIYGIIFISHILTFSWIIHFIMRNRFAICRKQQ